MFKVAKSCTSAGRLKSAEGHPQGKGQGECFAPNQPQAGPEAKVRESASHQVYREANPLACASALTCLSSSKSKKYMP